jgi:thymidylate synthase (FAD)
MTVTLTMSTPEIEISNCAKICYGNQDSSKDITSTIVHQHKHLASLRFAYATVRIDNLSVAAQNQMVRSSHLDYMVQSKRYVSNKKGGFSFIMPTGLTSEQQEIMQEHWDTSIVNYNFLIKSGTPKEDARAVLPANTSTNMYVTGNLQGFISMLKLRLDSHAQHEIRVIAYAIYKELAKAFPKVFTEELGILPNDVNSLCQ